MTWLIVQVRSTQKNEIELLWSIRQGMMYYEDKIEQ